MNPEQLSDAMNELPQELLEETVFHFPTLYKL